MPTQGSHQLIFKLFLIGEISWLKGMCFKWHCSGLISPQIISTHYTEFLNFNCIKRPIKQQQETSLLEMYS